MTYPGLVLLFGVGIGLATFLHYIFSESRSEDDQRQREYRYGYAVVDDGTSGNSDDWGLSPTSSHSDKLNRRNLSLRENGRRRSHASKEDINNCSICQDALVESDVMQLHPCRHNFHKDCIKKLRSYTPRAPCPNCRRSITYTT